MSRYLLISLFSIFAIGILVFVRHNRWSRYYQNKLYRPANELLVKAAARFSKPGRALDLGCGVGNETAYLANQKWRVWSIDAESQAISILRQRKDIKSPQNISTLVSIFENIDWSALPKFDLIWAGYAMPFIPKDKLNDFWQQLITKISGGGRFAGHFFGLNYRGWTVNEMKKMNFLAKDEVLKLFRDFDIEFFQEIEKKDVSGTGKPIFGHIFEIIARKRAVHG